MESPLRVLTQSGLSVFPAAGRPWLCKWPACEDEAMKRLLPFLFTTLGCAPALPCSLEFPAPTLDGVVVPEDGGTLPANGVVHLEVFNLAATGASVRASLRADTEDDSQARTLDIDEEAGVVRVNLEGLVPSTSYTLTLSIPAAEAFTESDLVRDINFTTTAEADRGAPTIEGEVTVDVTHYSQPLFPSFDCGGQANNTIFFTVPDAVDAVGVAGLKLFRVRDDGTRELRQFSLDLNSLKDTQADAGDYAYEIVAVDMAGNESVPLDVPVNVSGCSAAGAGTPMLAFALALLVRRHRARHA
jgi:uncharacterized protein (TIGR03382 family)